MPPQACRKKAAKVAFSEAMRRIREDGVLEDNTSERANEVVIFQVTCPAYLYNVSNWPIVLGLLKQWMTKLPGDNSHKRSVSSLADTLNNNAVIVFTTKPPHNASATLTSTSTQ
jgi:hypothetical protein